MDRLSTEKELYGVTVSNMYMYPPKLVIQARYGFFLLVERLIAFLQLPPSRISSSVTHFTIKIQR